MSNELLARQIARVARAEALDVTLLVMRALSAMAKSKADGNVSYHDIDSVIAALSEELRGLSNHDKGTP